MEIRKGFNRRAVENLETWAKLHFMILENLN